MARSINSSIRPSNAVRDASIRRIPAFGGKPVANLPMLKAARLPLQHQTVLIDTCLVLEGKSRGRAGGRARGLAGGRATGRAAGC